MRRFLQWVLPPLVVAAGVLIAFAMVANRPEVAMDIERAAPPAVRFVEVARDEVRWTVRSQGTVRPRTVVRLVSEVAGRVNEVSPALAVGAFVEEDQVLVELDGRDYEFAAARARADIARAEVALGLEQAEAEVARREWKELGSGEASGLALREPQLAEARAALEAARAVLGQAELDLERTAIRAPFAGRVRSERADVGQYLGRGEEVAVLYAVDVAEIRLSIPDRELAALDLSRERASNGASRGGNGAFQGGTGAFEAGPRVILRATFGGAERDWVGHVVRAEGEIDPKSRMVNLIAEVEDPYGLRVEGAGVPLAFGLFVEAEILGVTRPDVVRLPRAALREGGAVLVVDRDDRLWRRQVEVLRADEGDVFVGAGLESGERVCVSALATVIDGMRVRPVSIEEEAR